MGTSLVNTPKTTSYAFGRRLLSTYWIEMPYLKRYRNKALQQHFKNYEAKLNEAELSWGRGRGQFFGPRGRGRDEDLTSLYVSRRIT